MTSPERESLFAAHGPATALVLQEKRRADAAEAERDAARETAKVLNRRATQAEAVVMQTVEDCKRQGFSVGRALANVACNGYAAENVRLRDALRAILAEFQRADGTQGDLDDPVVVIALGALKEQG